MYRIENSKRNLVFIQKMTARAHPPSTDRFIKICSPLSFYLSSSSPR